MKTLKKIFNITLWSLISVFFAVMFAVFMIAEGLMLENETWINNYLGINPYSKYTVDTGGEPEDTRYFKSDYELFVDSEGNVTYDHEAMRAHSMKKALEVATEGSVLLWNNTVNGAPALPLSKGAGISFFGGAQVDYVYHGVGSGYVEIAAKETFKTACEKPEYGLRVNPTLWNAYAATNYKRGARYVAGIDNYIEYTIDEIPYSRISGAVDSSISGYGDAAVMIISRTGGENCDTGYTNTECLDDNYMDLSKTEAAVIEQLVKLRQKGKVQRVILLINSANAMQFKHIKDLGIDACLWVGLGGSASYSQVAALLSGAKSPYGRLADTYVYDNDGAPAAENFGDYTFAEYDGVPAVEKYAFSNKYVVYQEGIYVGYRYYETRYEDAVLTRGNASGSAGAKMKETWVYADEVAYPFGYGKSYTTFEYSDFSAERKRDGDWQVSVKVRNTGSKAGKEVVQIYLQKPYTDYDKEMKIEKAAVELVGFAKTEELAPGAQQSVEITVDDYEFKTYDSYGQKTYITEKGDYYLAAGKDAHDALNNILAAKGKSKADGMDAEGNAALTHKHTEKSDDYETYSVSPFTKNAITNRFDNADVNLYAGTKGQEITYLSRSNWQDTYPKAVKLTCIHPDMVLDMQYGEYPLADPKDEMPKFGEVTSVLGRLTLPMLMDLKYDDPTWDDFLNQITWEDANTLITAGANIHDAVGLEEGEELIVPEMLVDDGPCGIRQKRNVLLGSNMAFPCNVLLASTWDTELVNSLGDAFGMEIMHAGYTGIWGTGANIHRCGYSGRNWEYFSEDGFLSGKMTAAETLGLKNRGIVVFTKHFILNEQERDRYGGTVWANEQTVREIYLKGFEAGITEGKSNGLMTSLTRIGCVWAGRHNGLLKDVLRGEWGFVGICETDAKTGGHQWDNHASALAVIAGQDLWLGSGSKTAFDAYRDNATVCKAMRESCHRILYTRLHSNAMNGVSANTRILYTPPWWRSVITVAQTVSGILMGLALCGAVAAITFKILDFKKDKKNKGEIV